MATDTRNDILPPRYRSVETVAHGGMGEIYKATDDSLGREVAVKVLAERFAQDEASRARFTREALAAARLSGEPSTVTIYDVGEWNDRPYLVMELATGGTVAERIDDGGTDPGQALRWLAQAGEALDAAHARGVIHRDVKPANLLLARDGSIRVADFGIASAAGLASVTIPGTVLGTLGYLAPEQASGGETGPAADRYSLAVVAYELLAGERPYERAGTGTGEAAAAARDPVPAISSVAADLPATLDPVFERALAKDPARRYPSCAEFVADLRRAFDEDAGRTHVHAATAATTPLARPAATATRSRPFPWLPVLLFLAGLAAAGLIAALALGGDGDNDARQATGTQRAPVVKTVTARGDTVTVTAPAPPAPPPETVTTTTPAATPTTTPAETPTTTPAETPTTPDTSGLSGSQLNDAAWQKMQAGDYAGANPLLEQAVQKLSGTGSLAEAYALYNLAFTRFTLGSCDGVMEMLDQSEAIQGKRKEIDSLRKDARKSCR